MTYKLSGVATPVWASKLYAQIKKKTDTKNCYLIKSLTLCLHVFRHLM